jgi:hypothetical protein
MANERPESPIGRIAAAPFEYCADCECDDCKRVFSHTFCHRCSCSSCSTCAKDPPYIPEHHKDENWEKPLALGKRRMNMFPASPVKRIKADSLNTAVKKLVNAAAISAANATLCVPDSVHRFCLLSLGHSAEDCLETCHIVPRALGEDDVLFHSVIKLSEHSRFLIAPNARVCLGSSVLWPISSFEVQPHHM